MKHTARLFFDREDHQLIALVAEVLKEAGSGNLRSLLGRHLHPQGIKELAASRGLRIAYAMVNLLGSLESSGASERIAALRSLRDEVLLFSYCHYQYNTARVLLQIMKELVRSFAVEEENLSLLQLRLAHDFRLASTGKPTIIRRELARYHLLEMPEEWNQLAFDDHVHDANSKGRKTPTHLVLDAWIKGLRQITVVYYNFVPSEVVEELLSAGEILSVDIQISVEFAVRFREKYIRFCWEPYGFSDKTSIIRFLKKEEVVQFFEQGREVSCYQQQYVFAVLDAYNQIHRGNLAQLLGRELKPLSAEKFRKFVGPGQPTLLHLANFIRCDFTQEEEKLLSLERLIDEYLLPKNNPGIQNPRDPRSSKKEDLPELLCNSLPALLSRLQELHQLSRFTLNMARLSPQDFLEILYSGGGEISHIEVYNLKNHKRHAEQLTSCEHEEEEVCLRYYFQLIGDLQRALTENNVIALKRAIRAIIADYEQQIVACGQKVLAKNERSETLQIMKERKLGLLKILGNLEKFHTYYRGKALRSRLGSSSTGHAVERYYGMGLVVVDTLPSQSRKQIIKEQRAGQRSNLPVQAILTRKRQSREKRQWTDWRLDEIFIDFDKGGNIATLGGGSEMVEPKKTPPWFYLNTNLKNVLKVVIGFIPAFLTFMLTKEWWLLAWCGAPIWFAITGLRNIIQSVLGGGGINRSPLLPWNSLISWGRVADSLLYTGFSVPLLDWLVKNVFLADGMNVTTATNPVLLYAIMGLVNGIYISGHNLFRGLPRSAVVGNFFRSLLAIPVAVGLNTMLAVILGGFAVPGVDAVLQRWAAIISKFSSDCVAAIIEGLADRRANINIRRKAYMSKFAQVFDVFSTLDLMLPEIDTRILLLDSRKTVQVLKEKNEELQRLLIVNALDLLYFWFYQPRAEKAFVKLIAGMSMEEWRVIWVSQYILQQKKVISQLFVDGLVGANFARALSFYLDNEEKYLRTMDALNTARKEPPLRVVG